MTLWMHIPGRCGSRPKDAGTEPLLTHAQSFLISLPESPGLILRHPFGTYHRHIIGVIQRTIDPTTRVMRLEQTKYACTRSDEWRPATGRGRSQVLTCERGSVQLGLRANRAETLLALVKEMMHERAPRKTRSNRV